MAGYAAFRALLVLLGIVGDLVVIGFVVDIDVRDHTQASRWLKRPRKHSDARCVAGFPEEARPTDAAKTPLGVWGGGKPLDLLFP